MTRQQLIARVAKKTGIRQKETKQVVDSLIEVIQESLLEGERVVLRELLILEMVERAEREYTNPSTGESVGKRKGFKCKVKISDKFKDRMNNVE